MSKDLRLGGAIGIPRVLQKSRFNSTRESDDEKRMSSLGFNLFHWNLLEEKEALHSCKEKKPMQRDHLESNCLAGDSDKSRLDVNISPASE